MLAPYEFAPMLKSLLRQPYRALLVVVQLAITMMVITNAIFIVIDRHQFVSLESGADEANIFSFISEGFSQDFPIKSSIEQDLRFMRAMPGVVSATQSESVPYNDSYGYFDIQIDKGTDITGIRTAYYRVDEFGLKTFDVALLAGENFSANEVTWKLPHDSTLPPPVLLSKAAAEKLFGENAWQDKVGNTIYYNIDQPLLVKGIYDKLQAASPFWDYADNTMLSPIRVAESQTRYVVRTEPGRVAEVISQLEQELVKLNDQRRVRTFRPVLESKQRIFANDYATIKLLTGVVLIVTLVTAIGIAGLVGMNVNGRKRHIGIRRALGASRGMIVRYYMLENLLLSLVGASIGALLAVLLNMQLVERYGLAPLDLFYLPTGIASIILLSLVAAFWPAFRAAQVPPAEATRNG